MLDVTNDLTHAKVLERWYIKNCDDVLLNAINYQDSGGRYQDKIDPNSLEHRALEELQNEIERRQILLKTTLKEIV